jgi:chemotaxis protein methyltransferase CheR
MARLTMSPQVFVIMSRLIEEKLGLHFTLADRALLEDKVGARAEDAGFESLLDYYYYLRYDESSMEELDALTDTLVVGETYFFREIEQLEAMVAHCIAPLARQRGKARVWSAACATGEEPLSLAMLLARDGLLQQVELVATDVSPRALASARSGQFGRRSLRGERGLPGFAAPWMTQDGDRVVVRAELRDAVQWKRVNLLLADEVRALGIFDVILCKNVLIYFRDDVAQRVLGQLGAALSRGGALFAGVSESLLRFDTALEFAQWGTAFAYRRVK